MKKGPTFRKDPYYLFGVLAVSPICLRQIGLVSDAFTIKCSIVHGLKCRHHKIICKGTIDA